MKSYSKNLRSHNSCFITFFSHLIKFNKSAIFNEKNQMFAVLKEKKLLINIWIQKKNPTERIKNNPLSRSLPTTIPILFYKRNKTLMSHDVKKVPLSMISSSIYTHYFNNNFNLIFMGFAARFFFFFVSHVQYMPHRAWKCNRTYKWSTYIVVKHI